MKRISIAISVCLAILAGCSRKEEPAAAPPPSPAKKLTVKSTPPASPAPLEGEAPHNAAWSIPSRGVVLWLIGDDAKTEFGGSLQTWTNEYLPNAKAAADRPEMQPGVAAGAINQHAVVRFDGLANIMETNVDISPEKMPNATICAAFNSRTAAASPLRKLYGDDDGGFDRAAGLDDRASGGNNYGVFTGSGVSGYFTLKANETYVTCDQYTKDAFSGWVDGKLMLDKIPGQWGTALPNLYIGGTGPNYHEPWQGDLAEIVVYARVLPDLERMQVEDYLAKKYGVALTR
jgi:hypothetical protein